ncbi:hypothetical protein [Sphingomonas phyllosphaerae]|uniref:hypothetical protein n=1 Tax=Sphingomonas phyllosphaerae TaxID=257003 RepID=UPI0012DF7696|nr:hypothetical protein [Sphingomonas phyllosphaerae]
MHKAACLLVAISSLFAIPAAAQNGFAGTVTVTNVVLEGDQVLLQGTGMLNPLGCPTGNFVILSTSAESKSRFLSVAMTALSGGFKVDLWVQGCGGTSWGPSAIAYHMNLHR